MARGESGKGTNASILHKDKTVPLITTVDADNKVLAALVKYIKSSPNGKICTVGTKDVWNLAAFYVANAHVERGTFKIKTLCLNHKDILSLKTLEDGLDWICLSDGSNNNGYAKVLCTIFLLFLK